MKTNWLRSIVVLFAIVVLSGEAHAADTSNLRWPSIRVKVTVSAPDNIKGAMSSYLNRELRSLNDVELVDTNPFWEIDVVAMELKTVGGYTSGVALSTVIIRAFDNQTLSDFLQPKNPDIPPPPPPSSLSATNASGQVMSEQVPIKNADGSTTYTTKYYPYGKQPADITTPEYQSWLGKKASWERDIVLKMTQDLYGYTDHWLRVGSRDDLQELCKGVVADFDTKYLEEIRKLYPLMRQMKELLQKSK